VKAGCTLSCKIGRELGRNEILGLQPLKKPLMGKRGPDAYPPYNIDVRYEE